MPFASEICSSWRTRQWTSASPAIRSVGSPFIRFYRGMPLNAPEGGHAIGTLCVLDECRVT